MHERPQQSLSFIGVKRDATHRQSEYEASDYDSPVARRRRVSAREARKRKKRKKAIRLYSRLALLICGACLVLVLGISLISMCVKAISSNFGDASKEGEKIADVSGNEGSIDNNMQTGGEPPQGHLPGVESPSGNGDDDNGEEGNGEGGNGQAPGEDEPITIVYGDDLYNDGEFVVCVDPGHGGNDVGCVGVDGTYEKNDVLKLADYLVYLLEEAGVKVVRTRSADVWVNLEDRPAFANEHNADLLISLHRNTYPGDESVKGFEAWINSEDSENAEELAKLIMAGLVDTGISKNRGVKKGSQNSPNEDYAVNIGSKMPSVLLEMGFMSSPTDNELFRTYTKEYAQAIADAIIQWSQGKQY